LAGAKGRQLDKALVTIRLKTVPSAKIEERPKNGKKQKRKVAKRIGSARGK